MVYELKNKFICRECLVTGAGAVGPDRGADGRRRAARVHGRRVVLVVLGAAGLDGPQVAVAAGPEARGHGQVQGLGPVLGVGAGSSEAGLGDAVLVVTRIQVTQLETRGRKGGVKWQ